MDSPVIIFPHLGITIESLPDGFYIGSFHIAFYGVLIAIGMILAVIIGMHRAKKTNQYPDDYIDIGIISIIAAIVGARLYYVIFSWDQYKDNFWSIFNIRQGGLAIYGGVIGGIIATFVVCKVKKIGFLRVLDTAAPGIVLAQAIGRWGNFFNKEAYGTYTDSLFAMQIRTDVANGGTQQDVMNHLVDVNGTSYIQVHPTFLYESAWCLLIFILIMLLSKYQQYNGEVLLWYVGGYALERSIVEGLRTDQLRIGDTVAVSQLLSIGLVAAAFVILLINRIRIWTHNWEPNYHYILEDSDPGSFKSHEEKSKKKEKAKKAKWQTYTVENKTEDEPEAKTEDEPEAKAEAEPEATAQDETEAKAEAEPEATAQDEPETTTEGTESAEEKTDKVED